MSMTVDLLAKWLYVMKENCDYYDYCKAVAESDLAKCKELETKFGTLSTLYADWGDIDDVTADSVSESFKQWLKPRESLFFVDTEIKAIENPLCYKFKQGYLLLEIPLLDTKTKTIDAFRDYIEKIYDVQSSASEDPINICCSARSSLPKYQLFGGYNKKIEGRLHKAFYFRYWLQRRLVLKKGKLYWGSASITDIVRVLKQDPNNPFGWKLSDDDRRALKNGRSVKTIFIDSERTQIKRSIKDLQGYIHNTIYGRFPDPTPAA